jgi:hypothetical protein
MRGAALGCLALALLAAGAAGAQDNELGGMFGYGIYRNGTVFGAGQTVSAGVYNRFTAGAVIGEDMYEHISGEIRYTYQDGHPFLSGNGSKTEVQGESHTFTYDVLFHLKVREAKLRPFLAAGAGVKGYIISGPVPGSQDLSGIASITNVDQWMPVVSLGAGVKYRLRRHVVVRADFRDYLTKFPRRELLPATGNTARGIFQQFTPMVGLSYMF